MLGCPVGELGGLVGLPPPAAPLCSLQSKKFPPSLEVFFCVCLAHLVFFGGASKGNKKRRCRLELSFFKCCYTGLEQQPLQQIRILGQLHRLLLALSSLPLLL
ncbi:hypothetical protein EJ06DRAFT_195427 [Trichodelitschia bisporula]|uniref:Uncharacterized protein n=1 Tax=Trichodelitschia bisporula TaxID=703511 RepID=A0A6G1I8D6_9PEZI|nr:hypothetical protein EJ06DRAFT_195427 [Trichodelitschia bisporula]